MTTPQISLLMTVYNGMPYLPEACQSVLASEGVTFEFVIVDNCSTDGSRAYLAELADSRVRVISNAENLGQTAALNVGLNACRAPFVARLDADDLILPDRLAWQARYLSDHADTGLVGGQMIEFTGDGGDLRRTRLPTDTDILKGRMIIANCFDHSSVAYRLDAARAAGGYPEDHTVSQDFALFSRIMRDGWEIRNVDRLAARVRAHAGQIMAGPARQKEFDEGAAVAGANLAWLLDGDVGNDRRLSEGRAIRHLITGMGQAPSAETVRAVVGDLLASPSLTPRQRAYLAIYLFGGRASGRFGIRYWLLCRALRLDAWAVVSREMAIRAVRPLLSAVQPRPDA